ncbi:MAG: hypothetical protein ACHQYP_01475 [Nitrospiria bacterium]
MSSSLLVSSECPTCGAPLDFMEGANAVQCIHCKSNLLVTGRKQMLSYFVRPRLDIHRGVAKAMVAHKEAGQSCRMISPQLYFIPYYRLMGHDFRWESKPKERRTEEEYFPDRIGDPLSKTGKTIGEGVNQLFSLILGRNELPSYQSNPFSKDDHIPLNGISREEHEIVFQDQYIEKNFIGTLCKEFGLYSLGVRPAVLKLELFGKSTLESLGKVVRPDLPPAEAFERGMKTVGGHTLLFRQVLSWMLSLVYFPFWLMEVEVEGDHCMTVLDAVSETVIQLRTPHSLSESLSHLQTDEPKVIEFRPLVCPNCGWSLDVRKEDVIFYCNSCKKPWQIIGSGFTEVNDQVIVPSSFQSDMKAKYLPFWIIEVDMGIEKIERYFLPGFRYRRLKTLADIALALTKKNPSYTVSEHRDIEACGCYYDQEDAINLAKVIHAKIAFNSPGGTLSDQTSSLNSKKITLSWIPFHIQGDFGIDPFTGISISLPLLG